jgi:hypothetical protein
MLTRTVLTALASMAVASCLCHAADDVGKSTVGVKVGVRAAGGFVPFADVPATLAWRPGVTIAHARTDRDGLAFFELPKRRWDYRLQVRLAGCSDDETSSIVTHDDRGTVAVMELGPALVVAARDAGSELEPMSLIEVRVVGASGFDARFYTDRHGYAVFGCLRDDVVEISADSFGYLATTIEIRLHGRITTLPLALRKEPVFRLPEPEDYVVPVPPKKSSTASAAQKRTAPERR